MGHLSVVHIDRGHCPLPAHLPVIDHAVYSCVEPLAPSSRRLAARRLSPFRPVAVFAVGETAQNTCSEWWRWKASNLPPAASTVLAKEDQVTVD